MPAPYSVRMRSVGNWHCLFPTSDRNVNLKSAFKDFGKIKRDLAHP